MTTAGSELDMLATLGWMLDQEIVALPHVLRAVMLSADGLPITGSKEVNRDLAERTAAAVTGMQAVSREAAEFVDRDDENGESSIGPWELTMIQYENGFLFVMAAGAGTYLAVSTGKEADAEAVSFTMEKVIDCIGEKLGLLPRETTRPES
ncbi:roadblock/LC7 domain-containing protein [Streptomyces sp. NPDC058256]|uniref:roadblock/LC7 domain-containing protein n=1 Tax=Streptomyces sp. NPDC058256 TaxID=3346408 RepID=UPI0036E5690B